MKWTRIVPGVLVGLFILLVAFLAAAVFGGTEQVTDEAASTLQFGEDQFATFIIVVVAIVGALFVIGGGLAALVYFANRSVAVAEAIEDEPGEPLDYRSYGHMGAIALSLGLFALLFLAFLSIGVLPEAASEEADMVDQLFLIEGFFIALIFGGVVGVLLHTLFYFRVRQDELEEDGVYIHGNNMLEFAWTAAPALLVLVLGVYAVFLFTDIMDENEGEVPVQVQAQQWAWSFEYPMNSVPDNVRARIINTTDNGAALFCERNADGNVIDFEGNVYDEEGNIIDEDGNILEENVGFANCVPKDAFGPVGELVLLNEQPVVLEMRSQDVIHSFWVPELRIKQDVVPGVVTELRYSPQTEGEYQVICTELCGLQHSAMLADVRILGENEYQNWVTEQLVIAGNPVAAGEAFYKANCASCHGVESAPSWENLWGSTRQFVDGSTTIADEAYIRESIANPGARIVDPEFAGYNAGVNMNPWNLTEAQISQVIAYMQDISIYNEDGTLKGDADTVDDGADDTATDSVETDTEATTETETDGME